MELLIAYSAFGLLIFLIGVLITRWIFRIDAIIDIQQKQYNMLRQIAEKTGVEPDKIKEIDNPDAYSKSLKALQKKH